MVVKEVRFKVLQAPAPAAQVTVAAVQLEPVCGSFVQSL